MIDFKSKRGNMVMKQPLFVNLLEYMYLSLSLCNIKDVKYYHLSNKSINIFQEFMIKTVDLTSDKKTYTNRINN